MLNNMKTLLIALYCFAAVQAYSVGQDYVKASAVCESLCKNCGGVGTLTQDVCLCRIDNLDEISKQRCEAAKNRAGYLEMGWRVEPSTPSGKSKISGEAPTVNKDEKRRRRSLTPDTNRIKRKPHSPLLLRRAPRSLQPLEGLYTNMGFYGPPIFGQAGLRPYRSGMGGSGTTGLYEIFIGNSGEDTVQLVFPQSGGLEVEHQYIYQGPDGVEHPCSDTVSDKDLIDSNGYDTDRGSDEDWERGPGLYGNRERPGTSWEDRNSPIYPVRSDEDTYRRSEENYSRDEDTYYRNEHSSTDREGSYEEGRERSYSEEHKESYELVNEDDSLHTRRGISVEMSDHGYKYDERGFDYATASMADSTRAWDRDWDYTTSNY